MKSHVRAQKGLVLIHHRACSRRTTGNCTSYRRQTLNIPPDFEVIIPMEFCPTCGMLLQFEMPSFGRGARFFCPTCPYVCQIENKAKIKKKQHLVKKELEAVISKDDFRNLAQTEETCPHCSHGRAAYYQMQTRSADEPATTFYMCLNEKCGGFWKDG